MGWGWAGGWRGGTHHLFTTRLPFGRLHPPIALQESELCASLVPNSELALIEGGDHNFTQPAAAEAMIQAVVDFVLSQ